MADTYIGRTCRQFFSLSKYLSTMNREKAPHGFMDMVHPRPARSVDLAAAGVCLKREIAVSTGAFEYINGFQVEMHNEAKSGEFFYIATFAHKPDETFRMVPREENVITRSFGFRIDKQYLKTARSSLFLGSAQYAFERLSLQDFDFLDLVKLFNILNTDKNKAENFHGFE